MTTDPLRPKAEDAGLDALFAAARAAEPPVPEALLARVLADAGAETAGRAQMRGGAVGGWRSPTPLGLARLRGWLAGQRASASAPISFGLARLRGGLTGQRGQGAEDALPVAALRPAASPAAARQPLPSPGRGSEAAPVPASHAVRLTAWAAGMLDLLGGRGAVAGLAAAGLAGVWIGFVQPVDLNLALRSTAAEAEAVDLYPADLEQWADLVAPGTLPEG